MSQYPPNNGQPPNWQGQPWQGNQSQYPPQQPWGVPPDQPGQWGQQPSGPQWQGQSGPLQPNTGYQQPSGPQWPQQQPGMYSPQQQYQQPMQPGGYPPQQPKKKSKRGVWIIVGVLAALMLLSCIGVVALTANAGKAVQSSVDTSLTSVATDAPTSAATTVPANQHFKMGQVINVGSIDDVTVNSAKIDKGSTYNTPQKVGNIFLVFNVTLKNIAQQEQSISSWAQFNVTDSTGQKYGIGIDTTAGSTLDGKVEPGESLKGSVVFEVPGSVKSFVLSYQTNLFTGGQTEWDIQV